MRMRHFTSQKNNDNAFNPPHKRIASDMTRELLIKMLKRENELRLCDVVQQMYDEERAKYIVPSTTIEDAIQKLVLEEFGFSFDLLDYYRSTRARFPNDSEICNSVLYIKYDISRQGDLRVGDKTPNPKLITLANEEKNMMDFVLNDKPLVLIGGSYSWPPFEAVLMELQKCYEDFKEKANFLTIYIVEAHASDQWPLGKSVCIPQHKSLDDRMNAAKKFLEHFNYYKIPLVVDPMNNNFNNYFAAWPERYFIIYQNKVAYIAQPGEFGSTSHWVDDLRAWLNSY